MQKKTEKKHSVRRPPRTHRQIFTLNDDENRALDKFMDRYKIHNKSKFIRETLMITIIKKMEEDSPKLFDDV